MDDTHGPQPQDSQSTGRRSETLYEAVCGATAAGIIATDASDALRSSSGRPFVRSSGRQPDAWCRKLTAGLASTADRPSGSGFELRAAFEMKSLFVRCVFGRRRPHPRRSPNPTDRPATDDPNTPRFGRDGGAVR